MKANVLLFDRKPAREQPWTDNPWVYDLRTNRRFTLKENPLKRADLDEFIQCYNPANRHERTESERFKRFTSDELLKRDKANLDIFSRTTAWKTAQTCPLRSHRRRDYGGSGAVRPDRRGCRPGRDVIRFTVAGQRN